MKATWHTVWHGQDIVIYRDESEVDRVHAADIERVILVHRSSGESAGDVVQAVVELADSCLMFPADTGFAGRVNFERQAYWAERACIYWVSEAHAPMRPRRARWFAALAHPIFTRVPRAELAGLIEQWPLEGPQTWEQRKWRRIERQRPFAPAEAGQRLRA